jgi:hypothetical protein
MGKKSVLLTVSIILMLLFCAGCAKQGIDGRVSDRLSLLKEVKFKGDTMSAEMNNGEQFVFKRQK